MATIDLSNYNLDELKGLQYQIEVEMKNRQEQEIKRAREQILAIVQATGVSVEELFVTSVKKAAKEKGQKVQARYKNPVDSSQTWTGRGRQPKWIAAGLASGKTLEDFRI